MRTISISPSTRTIFVVDRQGVIRWTWVASREKPQPDYDAVIEEAKRVASEA